MAIHRVAISVTLNRRILERLDELKDRRDVTRSRLVDEAVKQWLDRQPAPAVEAAHV